MVITTYFVLSWLACSSSGILGLLVAFYTPEAHVATALGIFALEYGSLFYNAWLIDETLGHNAICGSEEPLMRALPLTFQS